MLIFLQVRYLPMDVTDITPTSPPFLLILTGFFSTLYLGMQHCLLDRLLINMEFTKLKGGRYILRNCNCML